MNILSRIIGKYHRLLAYSFYKRTVRLNVNKPIISFTFDDAPKTAFDIGGKLLYKHGAKATFFVALGLLGKCTEVGTIASHDDLLFAAGNGHELGCHTFNHLNTWNTTTELFMESVAKNGRELGKYFPGKEFKTFSYPISVPRISIKNKLEKYFLCCRGGGQASNIESADLNLLKAYFIDKRNNHDLNEIKRVIDYNSLKKGWLIFATHDVADDPSPFGCTPKFFDLVAAHAANSGSLLLTVKEACEEIKKLSTRNKINFN